MPSLIPRPPECALLHIIDAIGGKWPIMVMGTLLSGPTRFNALLRATGASQKMLSQTLKVLERDGLVNRVVTPSIPVSVEYSTTALGASLAEAIKPLWEWSDRNVDQVMAARARACGEITLA